MFIDVNGTKIKLLGDPHLGRSFVNGTPLARRGEREAMQWSDFEKSLFDLEGAPIHVNMGDVFDRWTVPYTVIYRAAETYKAAVLRNPDAHYYVIAGNHDESRDTERVSAFRLFASIMENVDRVTVVREEPWFDSYNGVCYCLMPWSPVLTAEEMADKYYAHLQNIDVVFGHWDVVAVGDTDNLIPAGLFKAYGVKQAVTGHDHTRRRMTIEGLTVWVTGSMQPYSFAEDPHEQLYVTLTLDELQKTDYTTLKNKCVRVILEKGESVDQIPDCLQWRVKYDNSDDDDDEIEMEVTLGDFSFDKVMDEVFSEAGIDPAFVQLAKQKIDDERAKQ